MDLDLGATLNKMTIYLGMPTYQGVHPEVVRNLVSFDLDSQNQQNTLTLHFPQSSTLTVSRNLIMKQAIEQNVDWIMQWDTDIQVKDDGFFQKAVEFAYKNEIPVLGLPCRLKSPNEIVYNFANKNPEGDYINFKECPKEPIEVDVIGTGLMIINAHWIRANFFKGPWFTVRDSEAGALPEDWHFCEKVKERGGKIFMFPIQTVHWGMQGFTFDL